MLECRTAESWIVRSADGILAPNEAAELEEHLAGCPACRAKHEAHLLVRQTLATRPAAAVPPAFAARVIARARRQQPDWIQSADWRWWTQALLPVAACLAVAAVLANGTAGPGPPLAAPPAVAADLQAAVEEWEQGGDSAPGAAYLRRDVSDEDVLASMLNASAEGAGEGTR